MAELPQQGIPELGPHLPSGLPQKLLTPPSGSGEMWVSEQTWKSEAPFPEEGSSKQPRPPQHEHHPPR